MKIKPLHPDFIMPTVGSDGAAAFDIHMPAAGAIHGGTVKVALGFAAAVPEGYVALLLPRSSAGAKYGVELLNTCGVIDADYRGEWMAFLRTKSGVPFSWAKGERVLQCMVVPVLRPTLELVQELDDTERGTGGFGSSGK